MAYEVSILPAAKIELVEAAAYYSDILPDLSRELLVEFFNQAFLIAKSPLHYQVIRDPYRKISLHKFPYHIVFALLDKNTITIVAFAHNKRRSE
jgi:toxin ParE1/3/4